jgi:predicted phage terminase large subunit-like protein
MTSVSPVDQKEAALYLLRLRQSANSFPGFMSYYYDMSWEAFHIEMQEVLDLLEKDALLSRGGNPIRNLLLTMPPRHAKSFNATVNFPAYALMRKPYREIMISSYNAELAATFGRGTRDIVTDQKARKAFKGFETSRETRAVDFWKTTAGGAYYSVGLNGTTTGRGANCLAGDTELLVMTGRGATYTTTMTSLFYDKEATHVLSYDHATKSPAWARINSHSRTPASELFEISDSSGGVVEATGEHPFYVAGRGYVEAKDVAPGDILLRLLPEDLDKAGVRRSEVDQARAQRPVLLSEVQSDAPCHEEHTSVPGVRRASEDEQLKEVLQSGLLGSSEGAEACDSRSPVQAVPVGVRVQEQQNSVLFHELQEYATFAINDDGGESEVHARALRGEASTTHDQGVHESASEDQGEGRDEVRIVRFRRESARSPHRPQPVQLRLEQSGDSVCVVPSQAPCPREEDRQITVSMVRRVRKECFVYNISVEGNENYFANGVLTHNCLEVDDPYKSREEADSATQRRKVWDFYTSGLLSRMQPDRDGQPAFQIVTQTRWHPDDMAGRIQESAEFKRGEWLHLNYQALTKKERKVYVRRNSLPEDDPRYVPNVTVEQIETGRRTDHEAGGLLSEGLVTPMVEVSDEYTALWPSRFPVEFLQGQRSVLGERDFQSLYQQSPYVLGGNIVKENWFKRYNADTKPLEFHAIAIGVDTAFKAKAVNDYSVFTVAGITEIGDIYILNVFRDKLEFPDLKRKAIAINSAYRGQGLRGFWIEDNASGQSLIQELRANSGVPVIPWKPGANDKVLRMTSITPLIESGRVFIPEEAHWLEDWLGELVQFPSVKHDDQADSFVIVVDVLSRMVVTGLKEFTAPIGELMGKTGFKDLLFAGQEMKSDPNGWGGSGGSFGAAVGGSGGLGGFGAWKGWGQ